MKSCSSKLLIFTIAFLTGWAMVVSFEGDLSFQPADALKTPGEGEHYRSFETAEEDQTEVNQRLLEALKKWNEKELERLVRMKIFTAEQAAESKKQMFDPNPEAAGRKTIAQIDALCRRQTLTSFQCLSKKEAAAFDIKYNLLPRYDSFSDAASFNKWRRKRKMRKAAAEILFHDDAEPGKM